MVSTSPEPGGWGAAGSTLPRQPFPQAWGLEFSALISSWVSDLGRPCDLEGGVSVTEVLQYKPQYKQLSGRHPLPNC